MLIADRINQPKRQFLHDCNLAMTSAHTNLRLRQPGQDDIFETFRLSTTASANVFHLTTSQ